MDSTLRILEISRLLEQASRGLTIKEIQTRLAECNMRASVRTIYRDIEAASSVYPIIEKAKEDNGGTRYAMEPLARVTKYLVLNPRELFALYFSRAALQPFEHTPFFEDLQRVFSRIENLIGEKGRDYLKELSSSIAFDPAPKFGLGVQSDFLDTIRSACEERMMISATYVSVKDNQPRERKLGPHFLYYAKGGIYLVAEDLEAKQVKTYSLPRFQRAEMLDSAYEVEALDPTEFFASSFGIFAADDAEEVELEFDSVVARFVSERKWHQSQRVVNLEAGRARISFFVALTPEFVSWVLGFGPNVRITKNERLIQKVVKQASKVREMYWMKAG